MSGGRHARPRNANEPTTDCLSVTTRRSHRLRRSLGALVIAVAVPAAFATSQAAAFVSPDQPAEMLAGECTYASLVYSEGSVLKMGDVTKTCSGGVWT